MELYLRSPTRRYGTVFNKHRDDFDIIYRTERIVKTNPATFQTSQSKHLTKQMYIFSCQIHTHSIQSYGYING
jgi:hypothetical protein